MSKVVIAATVSILTFVLGITGAYLMMPVINPDLVRYTEHQLDSLAHADSLAALGIDSLAAPAVQASVETIPSLSELQDELAAQLEDSLATLRQTLEASENEVRALRRQIEALQARWQELERRREEASQMSGTLTKLEDDELSAVLEQLEFPVLEMLYIEASNRNRTRLLQAMPAERAALVVRSLIEPATGPEASPPPSPDENPADLSM